LSIIDDYRIYGLYTKFISINSTVSRAMPIVVNEALLS